MEIFTPLSNASSYALAGDPCATFAPRTPVWGAVMRDQRAVVTPIVLDDSVRTGIAPMSTVLGKGHAFTGDVSASSAWSPPV